MDKETFKRLLAEIALYGNLNIQMGKLMSHVDLCNNPQCGYHYGHIDVAFEAVSKQLDLIKGMLEIYGPEGV